MPELAPAFTDPSKRSPAEIHARALRDLEDARRELERAQLTYERCREAELMAWCAMQAGRTEVPA